MYSYQNNTIHEGQSIKYVIRQGDRQINFSDFLLLLQQDRSFRAFFIELLSDVPFRAYQWETPPLTKAKVGRPFEFVVYNSPHIDLTPDPGPFRSYFDVSEESIAVFNNLGNDAKLIAPVPHQEELNYSHIGVFTKQAPPKQQHKLWQRVGKEVRESLSDESLWLNTAGGGVAWLHVRLDSRPKYYRHRPYTRGD